MIEQIIPYFTFLTALGSGLVSGLFFAFSSFIMKALGRLSVDHGIATMQSINKTVLNYSFFVVFMGTTLTTVLLMIYSLFHWNQPNAIYLLVGSAFYLLGSFLVTAVYNVPLNNALEKLDTENEKSVTVWKKYMVKWTAWNHVRTVTSFLACGSFILAL